MKIASDAYAKGGEKGIFLSANVYKMLHSMFFTVWSGDHASLATENWTQGAVFRIIIK